MNNETYNRLILEMQSIKAEYSTPYKESWDKEVIARNTAIEECIEIVAKEHLNFLEKQIQELKIENLKSINERKWYD